MSMLSAGGGDLHSTLYVLLSLDIRKSGYLTVAESSFGISIGFMRNSPLRCAISSDTFSIGYTVTPSAYDASCALSAGTNSSRARGGDCLRAAANCHGQRTADEGPWRQECRAFPLTLQDLADGVLAGKQHDHAVNARGDTGMGGAP